MLQTIHGLHQVDEDENPTGGHTSGRGISIDWQDGQLRNSEGGDVAPNGAFVEGVIAAAIDRLEFFQVSKFRCRENALAITKLEEALHWLGHRTAAREARGVEGTHDL